MRVTLLSCLLQRDRTIIVTFIMALHKSLRRMVEMISSMLGGHDNQG